MLPGVAEYCRALSFTPHDPTEDTESYLEGSKGFTEFVVSPLTIRQRILKENPL